MKWPTPQHRRVILLYAVSMAFTHLPLGRVRKNSPPHPARQRDLDLDRAVKRWAFSSSQAHTGGHSLGERGSPQLWNYERHPAHQVGSLAEDYR